VKMPVTWRPSVATIRTWNDLLVALNGSYHRLRQISIDEELFDVVSGLKH
jgi:F0F1-type ATP synthase gamma subunit